MFSPSKHQILVVDDEPSIRESMVMLLTFSGYDVTAAEDGFAALEQLRRMLPDLIISDLNMPQMSGYELLSVARRRFPQIMTVAMSGGYRGDAVPAGVVADGFFAKGRIPGISWQRLPGWFARPGDRAVAHQKEVTPAWIPRNGNDSQGAPYVVVTCGDCLRAFQLPVVEETTGAVLETPCRFCPGKNRCIIEPLATGGHKLFA